MMFMLICLSLKKLISYLNDNYLNLIYLNKKKTAQMNQYAPCAIKKNFLYSNSLILLT